MLPVSLVSYDWLKSGKHFVALNFQILSKMDSENLSFLILFPGFRTLSAFYAFQLKQEIAFQLAVANISIQKPISVKKRACNYLKLSTVFIIGF